MFSVWKPEIPEKNGTDTDFFIRINAEISGCTGIPMQPTEKS